MIDAVVLAPAANGVVAPVAFDEAVFRPHEEGVEGERLHGGELRDQDIRVFEQRAAGAEHEFFGQWRRIDSRAEIHAEVLDGGLGFRVDDGAVQRQFGDFEVRLGQQRRKLQGVFVIDEAVFGDGVGRKAAREIVIELKKFAEDYQTMCAGSSKAFKDMVAVTQKIAAAQKAAETNPEAAQADVAKAQTDAATAEAEIKKATAPEDGIVDGINKFCGATK